MSREDLKPCPFDAGDPVLCTYERISGSTRYFVCCDKCDARGAKMWNEKDAIQAWNRRTR